MTLSRRRSLACAAILLALVVPATAAADSIAVLGVEPVDVPEATASGLTDALRKRAGETAGVKLVPSKDFMEMKMLFGCLDPATMATCLVPAGKSLGAEKLIVGTLTKKRKKIIVSLKLVDAKAGTVVRFIDEDVPLNSDVAGNAARWFSSLVPAAAVAVVPPTPPPPTPAKTTLEISSDPSDAAITVDGRAVGKTPASVPVFGPGSHTVALSKDGFESDSQTVKIKSGEELRVAFRLKAKAPPAVATVDNPPVVPPVVENPPVVAAEHPGRTLKIVGAVGVVAGLVAVGIEIFTWQRYLGMQTDAHQKLVDLRNTNPNWAEANKDWFQKPTCTPPGPVGPNMPRTDSSTYLTYVSDCNDGNSLATMSTALLITGIVVGVAGVAAFGAGMYQSGQAEKSSAPKASLVPRLRIVSPVVSTNGGGVTAAFEF